VQLELGAIFNFISCTGDASDKNFTDAGQDTLNVNLSYLIHSSPSRSRAIQRSCGHNKRRRSNSKSTSSPTSLSTSQSGFWVLPSGAGVLSRTVISFEPWWRTVLATVSRQKKSRMISGLPISFKWHYGNRFPCCEIDYFGIRKSLECIMA
jgi:hypothetical protein